MIVWLISIVVVLLFAGVIGLGYLMSDSEQNYYPE